MTKPEDAPENGNGAQSEEAAPALEESGEPEARDVRPVEGEGAEGIEDQQEDGGELSQELKQVSAQAAEYLDGWQRARAELANYKKRVERERKEAYTRAAGDILTQYLEILDDLERALKERPSEGEAARWAEGIELVYHKFKGLLEAYDVEPIEAAGQPFNPKYHEAISHEETDDTKEGHVIEVVKQGYLMGDRVLRPALVRVAK